MQKVKSQILQFGSEIYKFKNEIVCPFILQISDIFILQRNPNGKMYNCISIAKKVLDIM